MNNKKANDNLIKEEGWKLRTIGGVRVLQGPEDNADLIAPYDTLYWTDSDRDKIEAVLGEPHKFYGVNPNNITTLSYPCLEEAN